MKRIIAILAVLFLLITPLSAYASDSKMYTDNIKADNNRLFDVPIYLSSPKTLCAATFTVSYNPSAVAFRKASANISNAKVKFVDNGRKVKAIFLCPNGVRINKKSLIISVKLKTLREGSSDINISASDTVSVNTKNFTPPASVKCNVICGGKTSRIKDAGVSARSSRNRSSRYYNARNSESDDADNDSVSSGNSSENVNDGYEVDASTGNIEPPIYLVICVALLSAIITALVMYFATRKKKNDKNDSNKG